jgi:predicted RNA-binding protein associated with RNAse of E/G family
MHDAWTFVDLELHAVRHATGTVDIEDWDEFEIACRDGWITARDAEIATSTATALEVALNLETPIFVWGGCVGVR